MDFNKMIGGCCFEQIQEIALTSHQPKHPNKTSKTCLTLLVSKDKLISNILLYTSVG